eukprot:GHVS01034446.1.p1 GENE.GHVS01034446.1~~GHVS01034446.1.p1  ORF type:complete len:361 (+),score=63.77 GHVS01034446.1:71-1153(+)
MHVSSSTAAYRPSSLSMNCRHTLHCLSQMFASFRPLSRIGVVALFMTVLLLLLWQAPQRDSGLNGQERDRKRDRKRLNGQVEEFRNKADEAEGKQQEGEMQAKKTAIKNERKDKEDGGQAESAFGSSIALESFGFYSPADGSANVWGLRKEKLRRQRSRQSEKQSGTPLRGNFWLQKHWEPEWGCALEERIGAKGDGGKWVCDFDKLTEGAAVAEQEVDGATGVRDSRRSGALDSGGGGCLVYSIGSNGDWSFEQDIYDRKKCEIHTFDHTLKESIKPPSFLHFHPWGLGPPKTEGEEAGGQEGGEGQKVEGLTQLLSLPEIVSRLGHRKRVIDILKVDVEGHEFAALLPLLLFMLIPSQ